MDSGPGSARRLLQTGDFFGELGLMAGQRPAHVVARDNLTCLVLSRTPVTPYAGRGAGATSAATSPAAAAPPGTSAVEVTSYLHRKLGALARHRTQYPIVPAMLPERLLQKMLGTEFFYFPSGHRPGEAASAAGGGHRRRFVMGCAYGCREQRYRALGRVAAGP